ncbi:MAG: carbamoyltransferase [Deltaproteobacteria bacterium]|nr:carbamoyltransferase [Deltaproteobacteria bacterium]
MYILGINAYHGDSAAALLKDGKVVSAIEEERIRRIKHWAGFPSESIKFCLQYANISIDDIDYITIGRDPSAHLVKKIVGSITRMLNIQFIRDRIYNLKKATSIKREIVNVFNTDKDKVRAKVKYIEHHRSHLASAFFPSPFEEAAIISIDGFGDFSSSMFAIGRGSNIKVIDSVTYPHSLGLFYTAFTQFLGFPYYGDEYKVMGLSSYGQPTLTEKIRKVIRLRKDGKFELNTDYFVHSSKGVTMSWDNCAPFIEPLYSEKFIEEFGNPRGKSEPINDYHKDLAASVQKICEEVIFHMLNALYKRTKLKNICIAGGVSQNSVANGKIKLNTPFERVYIPPAGYDAGNAIGSALWLYHQILNNSERVLINSSSFGAQFSNEYIENMLKSRKVEYVRYSSEDEVIEIASDMLSKGAVLGWFQGRTEFGPRALGNRSVLTHPGREDAKDLINSKIKRRESFRPFAPSILREFVSEYFEQDDDVFFMEKVFTIKEEKRKMLPAVTHVDGTGRLQTVHKDITPKYYKLINKFREKTGLPILLNTSFNENEPIVNTPEEALDCFLRTEMDALIMEDIIVVRNK